MTPRFATTIPAVPVGGLLLIGLVTFMARNLPPGGLGDPRPRAQGPAAGQQRVQNDRPAAGQQRVQNHRPPRKPATAAVAVLVGTWTCSGPLPGQVVLYKGKLRTYPAGKYAGRVTYAADGSFEAAFKDSFPAHLVEGRMVSSNAPSYRLWGHWTVAGGELTRTITKRDPPHYAPVGWERRPLTIARADLLMVGEELCRPAPR